MRIDVKLFASARERAGAAELALELPEGADVSAAVAALAQQAPQLQSQLDRVAFAVNRAYVSRWTKLRDRDELAIIPPVSGG